MSHSFIIVCADRRLGDRAAALMALLEQRGHEVESWTDKQFKAMKASIVQDYPDEIFVILGSDSLAEAPKNLAYRRFGGHIGWLGNFCVIAAEPTVLNQKEYASFVEYCAAKKEIWNDVVIPSKKVGLFGDKEALYILLVHEFVESFLEAFLTVEPASEETPGSGEDRKIEEELKMHLENIQQGFRRVGEKIAAVAENLPKIPKPKREASEEPDTSEEDNSDG